MSSRKVALVTGAGSGIGRACALGFLRSGYAVVLAGRRSELLDSAVRESGVPADRVLAMSTDITEPHSVRLLFSRTRDKFGRLDVLFNNAGVGAPNVPLDELAFADWRTIVDTNLTGA